MIALSQVYMLLVLRVFTSSDLGETKHTTIHVQVHLCLS